MTEQRASASVAEPLPLPSLRELYFEQGRVLLYQDRPAEATTAFDQALKEEGAHPRAHDILFQLARAYQSAGNRESAFRAYLQAAAAAPEQITDLLPHANDLLTRDTARSSKTWLEVEWQVAIERAELSVTQRAASALLLSRASLLAEDHQRALDLLKKADWFLTGDARLIEGAAQLYYELGTRFINRNELQPAIEALKRANELRPDHMPTYWSLVDALRVKSWQPEPPFVSPDDIAESLAVWETAVRRQWPGEQDSWAYLARAAINEQLARLPGADRWSLGWEALCYCERALALMPAEPLRHIDLARWYRFLDLDSGELQATTEAMRLDPDDPTVLEERIICLVNAGRFEEVIPVLEKRREQDTSVWPDAIEAYIKVRTGEPEAALTLIDKAIKNLPDLIWCHGVRAMSHWERGQLAEAAEKYRQILDRYHPDNIDDQARFGWAAYLLGLMEGNVDRATEIFSRLHERAFPTDAGVRLSLGQCYLARGNLARGEELLRQGIDLSYNIRVLDDLINIDLNHLDRASQDWPYGASVRETLSRIVDKTKARGKAISQQPRSTEEELQQMLELLPANDASGWLWIGANAGLARLYATEKQWAKAVELYRQLLSREAARFPEARQALANIADKLRQAGENSLKDGELNQGVESLRQALMLDRELGDADHQQLIHQQLGDAFLKNSMIPESLDEYSQALALGQQANDLSKQADFHTRIGYTHYRQGELTKAKVSFVEAIKLYRASSDTKPGEKFGDVVRSLISSVGQFWELDDALQIFAGEMGADDNLHRDLVDARRTLLQFLNQFYQLSEQNRADRWPVVTPIVLEIGNGLIPEDTSNNWALFKTYIPEMHDRLLNELGIRVPSVRVRGNNNLGATDYAMLLGENPLPLEAGSVHLDKRFCAAPPAQLRTLDILEADLVEATNPLTGGPGCWVAPKYWDVVKQHGLELWDEPLVFVIHHLEAVLRRNLNNFVGVQEIEQLLETWGESKRGTKPIETILPNAATRLHFARLLRVLARQRVPIVAGENILEAIQEITLTSDSLPAALRAVRLRLKTLLPGNNADAQRVWLPPQWEDTITSWLCPGDSQIHFDAPPDRVQEFIEDIHSLVRRELGDPSATDPALVVRNWEVAPYVRRLVEFEFPNLMVLSEEELLESSVSALPTE
jgi:tetratricopeptide (TPR) repeat protein